MKSKLHILLMGILLPFLNGQAQQIDTFSCAFDTLLYRDIEADPKLKNAISSHLHGAQRFRGKTSQSPLN